jgi:hypothetical protein
VRTATTARTRLLIPLHNSTRFISIFVFLSFFF